MSEWNKVSAHLAATPDEVPQLFHRPMGLGLRELTGREAEVGHSAGCAGHQQSNLGAIRGQVVLIFLK